MILKKHLSPISKIRCSFWVLFSFFATGTAFAQNSQLKVHVIGNFYKMEKFIFEYEGVQFHKSVKRGKNSFAFFIDIPDSIRHDEEIKIRVFRKGFWGLRFRDTETEVYYEANRKYLVLNRSKRLKSRYSFESYWSDYPRGYVGDEFWQPGHIPSWAKMDKQTTIQRADN